MSCPEGFDPFGERTPTLLEHTSACASCGDVLSVLGASKVVWKEEAASDDARAVFRERRLARTRMRRPARTAALSAVFFVGVGVASAWAFAPLFTAFRRNSCADRARPARVHERQPREHAGACRDRRSGSQRRAASSRAVVGAPGDREGSDRRGALGARARAPRSGGPRGREEPVPQRHRRAARGAGAASTGDVPVVGGAPRVGRHDDADRHALAAGARGGREHRLRRSPAPRALRSGRSTAHLGHLPRPHARRAVPHPGGRAAEQGEVSAVDAGARRAS